MPSYRQQFLRACEAGDLATVQHLMPNMTASDIHMGVSAMVLHNRTEQLGTALSAVGAAPQKLTLKLFWHAVRASDHCALQFVLDHLADNHVARLGFSWVLQQPTQSEEERRTTALLLLNKAGGEFYSNALLQTLNAGDAFMVEVVCNHIPNKGVAEVGEHVDLWAGLLFCCNAINMAGWGYEYNTANEHVRYTHMLHMLLSHINHNDLHNRLEAESLKNPDLLDDHEFLVQWIQEQRRAILVQAVEDIGTSHCSQHKRKL